MTIRSLAGRDIEALGTALAGYPYHDYRAYPRLSAEGRVGLLVGELAEASRRGTVLATGPSGEKTTAVGFVAPVDWDSAFFGVPMGRLGLLTPAGDDGGPAVTALVDALLATAAKGGLQHLAIRIDCGQVRTVQVLESRGFRLVDCLSTYMYDYRRDPDPTLKRVVAVRDYRPDDLSAVLAVAERMFAEYGGRFTLDPWLPRDAARGFYVEWVRNACQGRMADHMLVAERGGRLVGFLSWKTNTTVFAGAGVRIAGHGISATLPEGTGAYPGLLTEGLIYTKKRGYDFAEFDTPIHNLLPQRVFQRIGLRLVRTKYALHRGGSS